jgi:hypothetical protein
MWYATMITGQQPAVRFGRGWIASLGALAAGRFGRLPASSTGH